MINVIPAYDINSKGAKSMCGKSVVNHVPNKLNCSNKPNSQDTKLCNILLPQHFNNK